MYLDRMSLKNQPKKYTLNDFSLWLLLFSNFVTLFLAVNEGWNLTTIMWIYWFQSVTIGFFNFLRILQLKEFSTEGLKINGRPAQSTQGIKIYIAFFFLFHYGFFHFVYFFFLLFGTSSQSFGDGPNVVDPKYIFLTVLLFFVNHLFSYFYNRSRDIKNQNLGSLMFYPYARIIPMHLTIIFGSFFDMFFGSFGFVLPFFLVLKTFADVIMHFVEHNVLRKGEEPISLKN
jgi:hypothetical protein